MNKCGTFSAAAHFHVLVQLRSLMRLVLPIYPAYSHCLQLFLDHSPELPLYFFSFQLSSSVFDFYVCKPLACSDLPSLIC